MPGNNIRFGVGVNGAKGAASDLDQLRDRFTKLQSQGAKGFAIGAGAAVTAKALNLVGSAVGDVTGFLEDSVTAYRNEEVAQGRLNASLKANVAGWDGNTQAIKAASDAGIKLGFTNTDTLNSISLLLAATHDEAKALQVLSVAQDLARFKGISLTDAASALTSIEAGRARGLAQLGINVKDFSTTEERLAAVEKVAGGQAQEYAKTDLGILDAASAKTEASQEKLGGALSKIGTVVLPAVADALDTVVTSAERVDAAFGDIASGHIQHATEDTSAFVDVALALSNGIPGLHEGLQVAKADLDSLAHAGDRVVDSSGRINDGLDSVRTGADYMTTAASGAAAAADELGKQSGNAADQLNLLYTKETNARYAASKLDGVLKDLDTTLFGAAEDAGKVAQAQQDLADVLKQEPQKHSGREWTIWKGKVAEAKQALFDLQYQEKQQEGPKALYDWLVKQQSQLKGADAKTLEYYNHLVDLARVAANMPPVHYYTQYKGFTGGRAKGGPVKAGETYVVGEEGPELLQMGSSGGNVIPNDKLTGSMKGMSGATGLAPAAAGGAGMVLNIHISGVEVLTPGAAEELARRLEPVITRAQQRRGHVAAARAF